MIKLDHYRAISQNFHEFFGGSSSLMDFLSLITLVFRVVWLKDQLCFSQMMHNFKIGGI